MHIYTLATLGLVGMLKSSSALRRLYFGWEDPTLQAIRVYCRGREQAALDAFIESVEREVQMFLTIAFLIIHFWE